MLLLLIMLIIGSAKNQKSKSMSRSKSIIRTVRFTELRLIVGRLCLPRVSLGEGGVRRRPKSYRPDRESERNLYVLVQANVWPLLRRFVLAFRLLAAETVQSRGPRLLLCPVRHTPV